MELTEKLKTFICCKNTVIFFLVCQTNSYDVSYFINTVLMPLCTFMESLKPACFTY